MKQLIVRLHAGLGNQQFQYANAYALSRELNRKLILDYSYFSKLYHPVKYQNGCIYGYTLEVFNLQNSSTSGLVKNLIGISFFRPVVTDIVKSLLDGLAFFKYTPIIVGDTETVNHSSNNCFLLLSGFFQKSKCFEKYREELKGIFKLRHPISRSTLSIANKLKLKTSISVHIRRQDYVDKADVYNNFADVSLSYYENALKHALKRHDIDIIVVFSDDIEWCRQNVFFDGDVLFVQNDSPDYEHQWLMSQCTHNIIANSTFSWWAAYLNCNDNSVVYFPSQWFRDKDRKNDIYIPNDWIKIDN